MNTLNYARALHLNVKTTGWKFWFQNVFFFYILKCTQCYIQNGNNELLTEADFSCINDKFKKDNQQKKIKHLAAKICYVLLLQFTRIKRFSYWQFCLKYSYPIFIPFS